MAQQTAVEWLKEQYIERGETLPSGVFQEAKAMEKEQIVQAWDKRGSRIVPRYFLEENINGEQYYNETYQSNQDKPDK